MDFLDLFFAVTNGIVGVGLFAVALYRAMFGRASPLIYAANFVQASGMIMLVLIGVGVLPDTWLWTCMGLNAASGSMLASQKDPKKTGAVTSRSF